MNYLRYCLNWRFMFVLPGLLLSLLGARPISPAWCDSSVAVALSALHRHRHWFVLLALFSSGTPLSGVSACLTYSPLLLKLPKLNMHELYVVKTKWPRLYLKKLKFRKKVKLKIIYKILKNIPSLNILIAFSNKN